MATQIHRPTALQVQIIEPIPSLSVIEAAVLSLAICAEGCNTANAYCDVPGECR